MQELRCLGLACDGRMIDDAVKQICHPLSLWGIADGLFVCCVVLLLLLAIVAQR